MSNTKINTLGDLSRKTGMAVTQIMLLGGYVRPEEPDYSSMSLDEFCTEHGTTRSDLIVSCLEHGKGGGGAGKGITSSRFDLRTKGDKDAARAELDASVASALAGADSEGLAMADLVEKTGASPNQIRDSLERLESAGVARSNGEQKRGRRYLSVG